MHILIVDDSEDGRDITEAMLLAAGYSEISVAGSAAEAYRLLSIGAAATPEPPTVDLVLLDIVMPEIDGIETCARIRSDPRYAYVPIIMVTSLGDMDSLANAFVAGATDYVTKPLNRVELQARVRSALKLKAEFDRRHARERELLQLMSTSGDGRATRGIDPATGLLTGELAEAYLAVDAIFPSDSDTSVIALAIDRLDACRSAQGDEVAAAIMALVAGAVRATAATIGVVAATYRSGMIVVVAPGLRSKAAFELGEALRASVAKLKIANPKSISANYVTASVVVVTERVVGNTDRMRLLTRAISAVSRAAATGGNRVVSEFA